MSDEKKYTFRCTVCGWEVTVDTPELPEDFVCEVCGVGPDQFELVEEWRQEQGRGARDDKRGPAAERAAGPLP